MFPAKYLIVGKSKSLWIRTPANKIKENKEKNNNKYLILKNTSKKKYIRTISKKNRKKQKIER